MLSIPDMAILGAFALLVFGPEQLPRVARKAGNVMREIQNTSQSFIREMERAADIHDAEEARAKETAVPPHPWDDAPTVAFPEIELPADDGEAAAAERPPAAVTPAGAHADAVSDEVRADAVSDEVRADDAHAHAAASVAEKLAEPRPALDAESAHAEPPPQVEHPTHL